ncbi:hypothetical protein NC652_008042 [Populus alba x Populus x berolinensis]|nr:hypothetical protein NC652_008042 [Populus alba x Populus x berolinensis]
MRGEAREGFVTENRQQRHITERLRDPRGLRRGGLSAATAAPRNFVANGARPHGFARLADKNNAEDQPPAKRRLSVEQDGEIVEDSATAEDAKNEQMGEVGNVGPATGIRGDGKPSSCNKVEVETPVIEPVPRALPRNQDPRLVSRNKRMPGQLLGTLEKFRKEDMKVSGTEAFIQRSIALQRAEQKAHEEHERLRQQECEQIAEQRRRDLTLSARIAVKAEEKKLELLFLRWNDHHKKLSNFIGTKAEPPIYYLPKQPLEKNATLLDQQRELAFVEWKAGRRDELS